MSLAATLAAAAPPPGVSRPEAALWWLAKGGFATGPDWETAHDICQEAEGEPGHDLAHAIAHMIEGDMANADYWFRRAGQKRVSGDARAEWERAETVLRARRL